jgi:hypothetical protein
MKQFLCKCDQKTLQWFQRNIPQSQEIFLAYIYIGNMVAWSQSNTGLYKYVDLLFVSQHERKREYQNMGYGI